MFITNEELNRLRENLESEDAFDDELLLRCANLVHVGAFDEAVRSAFVLLEERLRAAVDREGMTGTALANYAFSDNGRLGKIIAQSPGEREGVREIFSGAFKLFRNPSAHGVVAYTAADGRAILGLVNLMLGMLERAGKPLPSELLPKNVVAGLEAAERTLGAASTHRLRLFLGECVQLGLTPSSSPKFWFPFKRYALVKYGHWPQPKRYSLPVLYAGYNLLQVPLNGYYSYVIGVDFEDVAKRLKDLGFQPHGKARELTVNLTTHNSTEFFKAMLDLLEEISELFEESLQQE